MNDTNKAIMAERERCFRIVEAEHKYHAKEATQKTRTVLNRIMEKIHAGDFPTLHPRFTRGARREAQIEILEGIIAPLNQRLASLKRSHE